MSIEQRIVLLVLGGWVFSKAASTGSDACAGTSDGSCDAAPPAREAMVDDEDSASAGENDIVLMLQTKKEVELGVAKTEAVSRTSAAHAIAGTATTNPEAATKSSAPAPGAELRVKTALNLALPQCTKQWQSFEADRPLNASQVVLAPVTPSPFDHFVHGSGYEGLFVHSPSNFAFCLIEKNGCSAWSAVFRKLMANNTALNGPAYGIAHRAMNIEGPQKAEQIFSDRTAVRAVMVRDPLARFASGFLNKCFQQSCTSGFCIMRDAEASSAGKPISFKRAVEWMLKHDPSTIDGHFSSQSSHCELKQRVQEYTIVGMMKKSTLASDAACILDRAGLGWLDTRGDGSGQPFWQQSNTSDVDEEQVLKRLFTKDAARKIIAHFWTDYQVFHLREPTWVAEATGEWYDAVPDGCSRPSLMQQGVAYYSSTDRSDIAGLLDEDDVSALAVQAGYFSMPQPF